MPQLHETWNKNWILFRTVLVMLKGKKKNPSLDEGSSLVPSVSQYIQVHSRAEEKLYED